MLTDIKSLAIEAWFESLTKPGGLKWPSVVKIKSIMNQIFAHAQRHELIPATIGLDGRPSNPVLLARTESESEYEAVAVSPEQMITILAELDFLETRLEWNLALLHAATGLRPEEAFSLQWNDVDWKRNQINIRRGWSKGRETAGKTKALHDSGCYAPCSSGGPTAMAPGDCVRPGLGMDLRLQTSEGKATTFGRCGGAGLFASRGGEAGVIDDSYRGRFGWHNLRHSLATFLADNDVSQSVIQRMLRHSKPTTTAIYTHRTNAVQMAAQAKFLDAIKVTSAPV